jgi:hypothetical protein
LVIDFYHKAEEDLLVCEGGDNFRPATAEETAESKAYADRFRGAVAVLDVDQAAAGNIFMTNGNAWRGDVLAGEWRPAIRAALDKKYEAQQ